MPDLPVSPAERQTILTERRNLKMARSAHAYVRGNTAQFYDWLGREAVAKTMPAGPPVWICGDCHTGNLGPVADLEGNVEIQIRDLDQTVVGNPAHDLLRLALSLAMAARSSDLPGVTTALMIEAMTTAYSAGISRRNIKVKTKAVAPIHKVLRSAVQRSWRHLAEERIKDKSPKIPLGNNFWPLSTEERKELDELFNQERERRLLPSLIGCDPDQSVKLHDAAYWVKGCSSLGRLRYAALVGIGKQYRLLDLKEAVKAAAPRAKAAAMPANNAERVVLGATNLSPFLGERMIATSFAGRQVFIRELRPQDLKIELSRLSQEEAVATARLLARVVGLAHSRQMSAENRRHWTNELKSGHTKNLEAPSWLWNSVVEMVAEHEASYLRHCRRFALEKRS